MSDQPVIDYKALAMAMISQKDITPPPTAFYGHGPGGAFSSFGLSKPVFGALILPYMGLGSMLPAVPSIDTNPIWGIMTGVTAVTGSNPDGVCDDCRTAGRMKLCTHSLPFGRYCLDTPIYQIDRIGERRNRAEFTDLTLLNQAFGLPMKGMNPSVVGGGDPMQTELAKSMFEFAVSWGVTYAAQLWAGSPANNTAGGGYREFVGLDLQINTGHVDAETGIACPAADSIIRSMGNLQVGTNGGTYVQQITNVMRNLKFIGTRTGSNPVRWVIAMRWSLFYELTEIWPCAYLSYRCSPATGTQGVIDSAAQVAMRDDMRGSFETMTGQYLLIDGEKVQVVIDDGITETIAAGEVFTSSLYFIPISILGGTPTTYWDYFDFSGPNAAADIASFAPDGSFSWSDNGRFLWHHKPPFNWCVAKSALNKSRIMLATPYLAARLTNISYVPVAHERNFSPSASYYYDGGGYQRDYYGPSYYEPVPRG